MGTTLTGTTPQDTYDSLIKVTDNGPLSGTAKYLSDGLGNDSKLALSTGNIGIGTASPADILHIVDSASTAAIRLASFGAGSKVYRLTSQIIGVSNTGFAIRNETDTRNEVTIDGAGNVGIGTGSAAQRLSILAGNGNQLGLDNAGERFTQISFLNNASQKAAIWLDETTDEFAIYAASGYTTPIYANGIERVRVTNNGLTFNGDTAAANALDDYEEGTWTPVLRGAATAGTYEQSTAFATYTKIGRQVNANVFIVFAASVTGGGTGYAQITGLPFSKAANQQIAATAKFNLVDFGATTSYVTCEFISSGSTSTINFVQIVDNGVPVDLPISAFGNDSVVTVSLTYFV